MPVQTAGSDVRQRILDTSYNLFVDRGVRQVGINEIIRTAGVAKASFYSHFPSKDDLILAFLEQRKDLFTIGYLAAEAQERADTPEGRLLAIFDIFDEWFRARDFRGCPYIRALLETGPHDPVGRASAGYLREIRDEAEQSAVKMGLVDPREFAESWMILLQGTIVAALGTGYSSPDRVKNLGTMLISSHRNT